MANIPNVPVQVNGSALNFSRSQFGQINVVEGLLSLPNIYGSITDPALTNRVRASTAQNQTHPQQEITHLVYSEGNGLLPGDVGFQIERVTLKNSVGVRGMQRQQNMIMPATLETIVSIHTVNQKLVQKQVDYLHDTKAFDTHVNTPFNPHALPMLEHLLDDISYAGVLKTQSSIRGDGVDESKRGVALPGSWYPYGGDRTLLMTFQNKGSATIFPLTSDKIYEGESLFVVAEPTKVTHGDCFNLHTLDYLASHKVIPTRAYTPFTPCPVDLKRPSSYVYLWQLNVVSWPGMYIDAQTYKYNLACADPAVNTPWPLACMKIGQAEKTTIDIRDLIKHCRRQHDQRLMMMDAENHRRVVGGDVPKEYIWLPGPTVWHYQ